MEVTWSQILVWIVYESSCAYNRNPICRDSTANSGPQREMRHEIKQLAFIIGSKLAKK